MTDSQRIFCDEYIKCRNATQAYLIAYPRCKNKSTAKNQASRLITKPDLSAYINEQLNRLHSSTILDAQRCLELLSEIANGNTTDEIVTPSGTTVEAKSKTSDRLNALNQLLKYYGLESKISADRMKLEQQKFEVDKQRNEGSEDDNASVVIDV